MKRPVVLFLLLMLGIFSSCSYQELMEAVNVQKPTAKFRGVSLAGLSFETVDLLFEFDVQNPNGIGLSMANMDYDLKINEQSFISGNQPQGITIPAHGGNVIKLPLTLKFKDLYQLGKGLKDQDSTAYDLACGFSFEVPILGEVRIPLQKSGHFPVVKLPAISIKDFSVTRINLTGADLVLQLNVKNGNHFTMMIDQMDLNLKVNGASWLNSTGAGHFSVDKRSSHVLEIPVSLNFLQMGNAVYQLIRGNKDLQYQLDGMWNLSTSIPIMGKVALPIKETGKIKIKR
ncbi:LEA type 2 family protein [bacterium]|nr:LEA type 2 family protein [bacterium]